MTSLTKSKQIAINHINSVDDIGDLVQITELLQCSKEEVDVLRKALAVKIKSFVHEMIEQLQCSKEEVDVLRQTLKAKIESSIHEMALQVVEALRMMLRAKVDICEDEMMLHKVGRYSVDVMDE